MNDREDFLRDTVRCLALSAAIKLTIALVVIGSGLILSGQPAGAQQTDGSHAAPPGGPAFMDEEGLAPPGANDLECRPEAGKPPVVLAHGTFANMAANFSVLAPALASNGYCVYALNYGDNIGPAYGLSDIRGSARELESFVDDVRAYTGSEKVSIVGHSQGAVTARYYIKELGGASEVEDLIGIAPSNHGTEVQRRLVPSTDYAIEAGEYGICESCVQQGAGSDFLTDLNSGDETPGEVDYTVVATRTDQTVLPYTSGFLAGSPDEVSNITLQDSYPYDPAGHLGVIFDPNVYGYVLDALGREGPARP